MQHPFLFIISLLLSAYICFGMVTWPLVMMTHARGSVWVMGLYYACPWALLYCALKSAYLSFQWRRMLNLRREDNNVVRLHGPRGAKPKAFSLLEALSIALTLLAILALGQLLGGPAIWRGWL